MIDVAIVGYSVRQARELADNELELMAPLFETVRAETGLGPDRIDFTCSGSSDFLAGAAFSFVMSVDATRPVPPIVESHVEMDGAWALYEAWVKLQLGEAKTALVYGYGKSSPGSLRDVLATQLDPYVVAPLWPDAIGLAGLQARAMLDAGDVTEQAMAEIAARSLTDAESNPHAVRSGARDAEALLAEPFVHDPLRSHDIPERADGGAAVILATAEVARDVCSRPAWIRGIDHRMDVHHFGARDLRRAASAEIAAHAVGASSDRLDVAELDAPFTHQEHLLTRAMGLDPDRTRISPSGGSLNGHVMMASGLVRIGEAAARIHRGEADRTLGHATSGPWLQQNLACVLEGE
ncbi:MAG: lipid-transfer protein [Acidimicrobiia bacterium]